MYKRQVYKLCVIGLGNPGSKYDHTRHNIGKDWLIDLSEKFSLEFKHKSKFQAEFAESHDGSILWIIPSNYVNDSGNTVSKILKSTNLTNENLFVLHDELDLKAGDIRLKNDGGHGGHNGLRDIISKIGNTNFKRLRIGIGHPGSKSEVTNWVLTKFSPTEKKAIKSAYIKLSKAFELILNNEFEAVQKILHTK